MEASLKRIPVIIEAGMNVPAKGFVAEFGEVVACLSQKSICTVCLRGRRVSCLDGAAPHRGSGFMYWLAFVIYM